MAHVVHLAKAPIVEAIIEIRVDLPPDVTHGDAVGAESLVAESLPKATKLFEGMIQFEIGPGKDATSEASSRERGMRYASVDGKRIVDFGLGAFGVHWLAPYTEWSEFKALAAQYWETYVAVMRPKAVTRIGVRFVNELALPASRDLSEFLVPGPVIPPALPQLLRSFISRVEIMDTANRRLGIVTQASKGLKDDGNLAVLLDIDVIREESYAPTDIALWQAADALRDFKNQIFFSSVTDLLLEQYT